jgi:hypothetical protein
MHLQPGGAQGRAVPVVGVRARAARAPPPSPSLAALVLPRPAERRARWRGMASTIGGSKQYMMGERQQRGGVGARRTDGKAAAGEGRRVGEGQRRAGGTVDAPAAVACMRRW